MSYQLSPLAEADLLDIFLHGIEHWGETQARNYANTIKETLNQLSTSPALGIKRDELYPDSRSFPAGSHILFYKEIDNGIAVARILHQNMDAKKHLK